MSKRKRAGKGPDKLNSRYIDAGKPENVKANSLFIAGGATAKLIRDHSFFRSIDECACGHVGSLDEWAAHLASLLEGRQKEPQKAPEPVGKFRVWCRAHQEFETVYRPTQRRNEIVEEWHGKATSRE